VPVAAVELFSERAASYVVVAIAVLSVIALPRLLHQRPVSFPLPLVGVGAIAFALPLGLVDPDPERYGRVVEHLSELVVVVALTNAGLRLDRPFSWRGWSTTWRLLAVTMPLTVAGVALLGWWVAGLAPAAALLLGAALSPTDPVLAAEVQVGGPGHGAGEAEHEEIEEEPAEEDEARFSLTSEAGLNDALAFPYTNAAILMVAPGGLASWFTDWVALDVAYKLGVGIVAGIVLGRVLAAAVLNLPAATHTGKAMTGSAALAVTLAAYGVTEFLGGYGFLATFVAAYVLRHRDAEHEYHEQLVIFVEQFERVLVAIVLLLLGGAVARGFIELSWPVFAVALALVFVVRPLAGAVGLVGSPVPFADKVIISAFGIRGVGSFFYVAYALHRAEFADAERVWSIVLLASVVSIVVHGLAATPALRWADRRRASLRPQPV
jgi:NhaP-type Na+/H+ or K+/H+ antiporter